MVEPGRVLDVPRHDTEEVLKEVGLRSISQYVEARRQHIFDFIVNRPIFDLCRRGVRKRGSSHRRFWWDQPMTLTNDLPAGVEDSEDEDAEPCQREQFNGFLFCGRINPY